MRSLYGVRFVFVRMMAVVRRLWLPASWCNLVSVPQCANRRKGSSCPCPRVCTGSISRCRHVMVGLLRWSLGLLSLACWRHTFPRGLLMPSFVVRTLLPLVSSTLTCLIRPWPPADGTLCSSSFTLQLWTKEADELQYMLDIGLTTEPEASQDPRPRLKILRLLLLGGLMDPERDRRHRRKPGRVKCQCGGMPSHDHISWVCPRFRELRAPALAALPKPLRCLPKCFKRTTVVPANFVIAPAALHAIQTALVNIWQQHIQEWNSAEELATVVVPPSAQTPAAAEVPVEKRGHVLRPTPAGGVFCCKCGRQTQYVKHVRLKITKTVCPNASLPDDRWLTSPAVWLPRLVWTTCLGKPRLS